MNRLQQRSREPKDATCFHCSESRDIANGLKVKNEEIVRM